MKESKGETIEAVVKINGNGVGRIDDYVRGFEVEILKENLGSAMHGDTVLVKLVKPAPKADKVQRYGNVIKVLSRRKNRFVGILQEDSKGYLIDPDDTKIHRTIRVSKTGICEAEIGDKIFVDVTDWGANDSDIKSRSLRDLGKSGEHETEIAAILYDKNFAVEFPKEVEKEAEEAKKFLEEDTGNRRDFRGTPTFTIDPDTAKDFDDALSVKDLGNNTYEIGIHIADVTHFVRPGTKLEKEAAKRATSIYMVDRTIPMLPETLSNDLCSLNPNEEKHTFSAVFVMDGGGQIKEEWLGRTLIKSDKRFTYEEAQGILDGKNGPLKNELEIIERLAKIIRKERFRNGSILFENPEVKVILGSNNMPIDIVKKDRIETQRIIEDFMLLANKQVAKKIGDPKNGKPRHFIYRVHDKPDEEKLGFVLSLMKSLGHKTISVEEINADSINQILKSVIDKPEEGLIQTATIRAMKKAIYTTQNIGHFGLGFDFYTHFTSPIRRYSDMMVHRLLATYLAERSVDEEEKERNVKRAEYSSQMERVAEQAERESIKFKQVQFMGERVGMEFEGIISGVTSWGIYVEEKKSGSEGLVGIHNLGDDYFVYNRNTYSIAGKQSRKKFSLGDKVKIKVKSIDLRRKQIDYTLVE